MLTEEEAARLRLKARHGELTPEEQLMYSEYMESRPTPPVPVQSSIVEAQQANTDTGSFGWAVLGFFVPIAGLILYLVWRNEKPLTAKKAGIGALVSVIVSLVFFVIEILFMVALAAWM